MEEKVVLDTQIVFDFFSGRNRAELVKEILHKENAFVSAISVFELFAGVTKKKHIEQKREFLSLCMVLPLDEGVCFTAAGIYTDLRSHGRTIGNEDCMIAACAIVNALPLMTDNQKHFRGINGLRLI